MCERDASTVPSSSPFCTSTIPTVAGEADRSGTRAAGQAPARPARLGAGPRQRSLVRRAQQVREVDLLVLVLEDRGLDGTVEELVGMAAEELVEGGLRGGVTPPAAARARG